MIPHSRWLEDYWISVCLRALESQMALEAIIPSLCVKERILSFCSVEMMKHFSNRTSLSKMFSSSSSLPAWSSPSTPTFRRGSGNILCFLHDWRLNGVHCWSDWGFLCCLRDCRLNFHGWKFKVLSCLDEVDGSMSALYLTAGGFAFVSVVLDIVGNGQLMLFRVSVWF